MTSRTPPIAVEHSAIAVTAANEGEHRLRTFAALLDRHVQPRNRRLLDLGAGHCKFSLLAARRRYAVTAVDGRTERVPAALGPVQFVRADVRHFDPSGYGIIAILGLLYHLELEQQEQLLRRCADGAIVIVETQVHVPEMIAPEATKSWHALVEREGYCGVDFPENSNPMAAIGNSTSFWHTEPSILLLFARAGFARALLVDPLFTSVYGARRFYMLTC